MTTLTKARALVEAGWCKGQYELHGAYCAIGAICKAEGSRPTRADLSPNVAKLAALLPSDPCPMRAVLRFNDGGTKADVLQLFDKAIANEQTGT